MISEKSEPAVEVKIVDDHEPCSSPDTSKPQTTPLTRTLGVLDLWYYGWEIFGIIGSGLAIVGLAILVKHYSGREAPDWSLTMRNDKSFHFTLNSLLSIISNFGTICAAIPITKALGQLKYLWFIEKDRTLADLETFDSASRGILGSLRLLWRLRFKYAPIHDSIPK